MRTFFLVLAVLCLVGCESKAEKDKKDLDKMFQSLHSLDRTVSNYQLSDAIRITDKNYPTGDELNEKDRIGSKSNPSLDEIERYRDIKRRAN